MKVIGFVIIILIFFCCKTPIYLQKEWPTEWYNEPPYNFSGKQLSYDVVSNENKEKYIKYLFDRAFFILEKDDYNNITGKMPSKKYVIALRALYTHDGGFYRILQNKNTEISVRYYVLGDVDKVYKSVLFIEVNELPNNVYVSYVLGP